MGLAEFLGLGGRDTRAIGVAGLLRDVGMTRVPKEIVTKAGPPTEDEWALLRIHPAEGAKIILGSEPQLDLAAVVAFEHHMLPGGGGYPTTHFERDLHFASKLVQVCDCYDALRTRRFHRGAWTPESALRYVEEKAGTVFDADISKSFITMMRRWERRIMPFDEGQTITPPVRVSGEQPIQNEPMRRGAATPGAGVPHVGGRPATPKGSGIIRS
jgi:HD-GYP domain-containing protein (c-di-GMP phosphodiesterase class II)